MAVVKCVKGAKRMVPLPKARKRSAAKILAAKIKREMRGVDIPKEVAAMVADALGD